MLSPGYVHGFKGGSTLDGSATAAKLWLPQLAAGALMAALERDLPVAHLESMGYDLDESIPTTSATSNLVHIWLEGDVYPQPRPVRQNQGTTAR